MISHGLSASALAIALLALAGTSTGAAEDCNTSSPWVRLHLAPQISERVTASLLLGGIRAELRPRGFEVCFGEHRPPPIATVDISSSSADVAKIAIAVDDTITSKSVSRRLNLSSIPPDSRRFAIVLAVDELLRASWAELALKSARPPSKPVPVAVSNTVVRSLAPDRPLRLLRASADGDPATMDVSRGSAQLKREVAFEIGAALAGERYAGGSAQLGPDVRLGLRVLPRLIPTVRFGFRWARTVTAPNGSVRANAIVAGAGLRVPLVIQTRYGFDAFFRGDAVRVTMLPDPNESALGHNAVLTAFVLSGGGAAWIAPTVGTKVALEAGAGAPVRPIRITDTGKEVTAVSGLALSMGLAFVGTF